ncbi:MAG: hypothetical protein HYU66_01905 [Armatimonadetes bacterium]|nr:hypothetical protein [Armatimonadota bacterium]
MTIGLVLLSACGRPASAQSRSVAALVPPAWEPGLVYYQSFDAEQGLPEVNTGGLQAQMALGLCAGGFRGRCGGPEGAGDPNQKALRLVAKDDTLSPHHPLSVLLWWRLPADLPVNGGFDILYVNARQGFVSTFARGGPWCGLAATAGVVQVYYLPGISNVNGIYASPLRAGLDLRGGVWHHSAMVISAGSLVEVYTDGAKVFETRIQGRPFAAEDEFRTLTLGGWGLSIDEAMVLRRPLDAESLADYVRGMWQMRAAYGW